MKKRILCFILCIATAFSGFVGISVANAAGLDESNYCADISEYRTGEKETWTYPSKEGYVFAGWYSRASFEQKYALTDSMVSGGAYAKFVDEDVFSVKCQVNSRANIADATMNLRMLTTVDDLTYQSVGFRFETGIVSQEYVSNTVYETILSDGKEIFPSEFSENSDYIVGHSMNNIPKAHYGAQFTITPIVVTLDGTTVEGVARSFVLRDDYKVLPDATVTIKESGTEKYLGAFNVYNGQWIVCDIKGLEKGLGTQGVSWRIHGTSFSAGGTTEGVKNKCYTYSDTIRVYVPVTADYKGYQLKMQVWNVESGREVTISNIRVTNEPDEARYYDVDGEVTDYVGPEFFALSSKVSAKAGQILSYRVDLQSGNLLNADGNDEQKTWIYLNDGTTAIPANQVYTNADGTQTVQVVLTEDLVNFKPAMEIQNLNGATSNKVTIKNIQILDALDSVNDSYTGITSDGSFKLVWDKLDINATVGQTLSFDIAASENLNAYIEAYKNGTKVVSHTCVSTNATHHGTVTINYRITRDFDQVQIYLIHHGNSEKPFTGSLSNIKVTGAKQLLKDPTSGVPYEVYSSTWPTGHVQGIAVDNARQYMYYSFTTVLVKMDMSNGDVVGTVNLPSNVHIGDLEYYNGKLYASLSGLTTEPEIQYVAMFDVDAITRRDMSYSSVMQTMYMKDLASDIEKDYYGLIGLDGVTFGTMPGDDSGKMYLFVAGIPETIEANRTDKNYQVLYAFDVDDLNGNMQTLDFNNPHKVGPDVARKLFVYTGQHYSGAQTLTYDYDTKDIWLGMYADTAAGIPRYRLLAVEHDVAPVQQSLNLGNAPGVVYDTEATEGYVATLAEVGAKDTATGIWGFATVPHDVACGFISLGNNYFYVGANGKTTDNKQYCKSRLYYFNRETNTFTQVTQ